MLTAFLAAFVLFLREGLEAALIVSILFAALRQLGQTRQMRAVWTGVALAVLGSLAGGVVVYATVREFGNASFEPLFEAAMFLVAVVLLTSMTFWMQKHSRTMKKELTAKAGAAGSGFALGVLAFTTVGREGIETAAFMVAFAFQSNALPLLFGALVGVLAAVGLCYMILSPRLSPGLPRLLPCHGNAAADLRGRSVGERRPRAARGRCDPFRHRRALEHVRHAFR